jgi:DNA sulfur modification protein DndD
LHADREKFLRLRDAIPKDQDVAGLVERLETAAATFGKLEGDLARLTTEIESLRRERDDLDGALSAIRSEMINSEITNEESLRLVGLAQKTQHTMRDFLRRATTHKIDRLSDLVTESFRYLLRKQTLIQRVQIDPESFRIDLIDESGRALPKTRLSEGEKQIFAIAVLWGLAQAAPRPLPAIIDTPMARLDSEHRQHLVERYFPNASHQVIILSTDTEIEEGYFEHLLPRVSRSFHLQYDDAQRCTIPEPGYFWPRSGALAVMKVKT